MSRIGTTRSESAFLVGVGMAMCGAGLALFVPIASAWTYGIGTGLLVTVLVGLPALGAMWMGLDVAWGEICEG